MPDTPRFAGIAFDCADPARVARFYADLLGGSADIGADPEWVTVTWDGPDICFQLARDHTSPDWPRGQQQAHIDFEVEDIAAAHARVLELGGTALDPVEPPTSPPERGFRVYADPAGHPFCLCRPTEDAWG
jgi:predicted enzyme related to lactoylglutathione lyase